MKSNLTFHIIGILTMAVWGTTFVSSKLLINAGLSPVEVLFFRFVIAYVCIVPVARKRLWADSMKDEFLLFLLGLSGGSVYFLTENTALEKSMASNVSLLIATTPIFTMLLARVFFGEPIRRNMVAGTVIALLGVAMVVFNGSIVTQVNPVGDMLALSASALWALYSIIVKCLGGKYSTMFITRKVFFYGLVSLPLFYPWFPITIKPGILFQPLVYGNLLFLGIVASMLCYILWNKVVNVIGASESANYIYVNPMVTFITSAIVLSEQPTIISFIGMLSIIAGVYIVERKSCQPQRMAA